MQTNTHLTEEQVAQCADAIVAGNYGKLDVALRNHLSACDECAAEVLNVAEISFEFKTEESNPPHRVDFKPWFLGAASVAAVALVIVAFNLFFSSPYSDVLPLSHISDSIVVDSVIRQKMVRDTGQGMVSENVLPVQVPKKPSASKEVSVKKESTSKSPANNDVGASFAPDQTLESLFSNFTQAYRGEDVVVLSKGVLQKSDYDSLKWTNPSKENLYVEFFDNKGKRIITLTETSAGVPIPELSKGLFYWKLINEDFDLLYVGKIVVE